MRNIDELLKLREENKKLKKSIIEKITPFLTPAITLITFYFGFLQFLYNQNVTDKRKYDYAFYDDKHKVIKEVAKSISKIKVIVFFENKKPVDKDLENEVKSQFINMDYAKIVLNEHRQKEDGILLKYFDKYEESVNQLITSKKKGDTTYNPTILFQTSDSIITHCSKILTYEKDSLNNLRFKFWPFRSSNGPTKK